jgi:penicillin-binding protein 2
MLKFRISRASFKGDIEPHEILLDSLAKRRETGLSEKKFEVPLTKKILRGFFVFIILVIALLFVKTFQLQVVQGENFAALALDNKFIVDDIQAERGVIYDKDMNQLVYNQPSFDLICRRADLIQDEILREGVLREVALVLAKPYEEIKSLIDSNETAKFTVQENLDYRTLLIMQTKLIDLPGFEIEKNSVRDYRSGTVFSQILGYKRKTGEKIGLEQSYDEVLSENPGQLQIERDAQGNYLSKEVLSLPESGDSLVLWLDSALQEKATESLQNSLSRVGARSGVVVALDPKTGGVLSMVSLPSFDANLFSQGMTLEQWQKVNSDPLKPLFNRAISGTFLTGSTIKPLLASAILEEELIPSDEEILCQGKITIPHSYDPSASTTKKDWTVHGWTDLRKAVAESCDVYFYTLGGGFGDQEGLGPTRIKQYLELFGWNELTGIDLPGETAGFIPDKDWKKTYFSKKIDQIWYDGDTYNMAIGQGYLKVTPLEVANSFVAIANGGTLFRPQIVRQIVDKNKNVIEEFSTEIVRENFIASENLQIARQGMRWAVTGTNSPLASSLLLNTLPVSSAAKTGTAELGNGLYNNWVTVFAPYDDPQIVLTVMLESVRGDMVAALPVAKEVLEWYFSSR